MARPSNTDTRREQIVAGLQAVMATNGYEGASVAQIARAAGLTTGLVHYHFQSKQEILLALVDRLASLWRERAAAHGGEEITARERLGQLVDAWLALDERADRDAVACWVLLAAEAVRQAAVRELFLAAVRDATAALESVVRAALAAEGRSVERSAAIAAGLMAAIEGYLQLGALGGVVPRGTAAGTLRAMAMGALDAQPLARRRRPARSSS